MTDIRNRIKTEIKTASERIKSIKDAAYSLVIETVMKFRYDHINPKHKDWAEYRRLKIEVSLWLAALHLSNPNKDTETKKFLVGSHRPKGVEPTDFTISVAKKIERLREKIKKEACVHA